MAIVLVTTSDPDSAGQLERAFEPSDRVRFVSGREDALEALKAVGESPVALIVSGGVNEPPF